MVKGGLADEEKPSAKLILDWLRRGERRQRVLCALKQPMTVRQIMLESRLAFRSCGEAMRELRWARMIGCLNPEASRSRLYWLTPRGAGFQARIRKELKLGVLAHDFPRVNWILYGEVCFSHRSAVIRALQGELSPPEIRRRACLRDASLRMSCNNVRDVLAFLRGQGLVRTVALRKRAHPLYMLTEEGEKFRRLLNRVEPFSP